MSRGPFADVVIVGGGVMGSAIAYFLASDPSFDGRVVVVERDPTYRLASSALSASSIRQQFSTPENIRMSQFGFAFLRSAGERLAVEGDGGAPPDVGLVEGGYLYLATAAGAATMREVHAVQRATGADVALVAPDELRARFPWLTVEDIALGSLGLAGEGWFDGYALTRALRRKAIHLGATYRAAEVIGLDGGGRRLTGVRLGDGATIDAGWVVDAAGPWAREVAAMAGVDLPVRAHRRTVFAFDAADPPVGMPLIIDPSGAWFRPDGDRFIGAPPAPEDDRPDLPLEPELGLWEEALWPLLAGRVPAFDAIRRTGAWAGYYEMCTFDHNAIVGPHPVLSNLLFANGFSGHGIQGAPAVGRAIAEQVIHGRYVTLDLSVFAFERIAAGRPIVERNVIG